ncbi:MAG: sigma-70 family RNA polymerase sigma factor [Myxococcota bacterium]
MHRAVQSYSAPPQPDAKELIRRHSAVIDGCARRLALRLGAMDRFDDLWAAGAAALVAAASRFDPSRGARFETFAEHRVRGAMLDEVRRQDHLPRRLRASGASIQAARRRLGQQLSREPTREEVGEELGVDPEDVGDVEMLQQPHVPLELAEDPAANITSADELVSNAQLRGRMREAVALLPERLQLVISLHYVESLTYREIAEILKVSEPRVCQLHAQAIQEIRKRLEG